MRKNLVVLMLLLTLFITTIAESGTAVYVGSWSGWWGYPEIGSGRSFISTGFPHRWGQTGFSIGFSKKIDDSQIYLSAFLPFFGDYDYYGHYHPYESYEYYYPYYYRNYGKVIIKDPESIEDSYPKLIEKGRDVIFYGGIQIHPAGRVKVVINRGDSEQPEIADIEIDGLPAGKTGDKPFEMGILIGKHKVSIKKDGKEVFSAEIDIERNKEVFLKIDLEDLIK
ncbi:MAG: hypothetical protein AABY44_03495 [Nitrospirota bacterium]